MIYNDTFCIMETCDEHVSDFLVYLSSLRPLIQLTMKVEKNDSLPYLDTLIKCRAKMMIDLSVYKKPTHTDRYF